VFVVRLLTVAGLTLVIASASFYLVERPIIAWSHRRPRERQLSPT